MKKNLYYRTVLRRRNAIKEALLDFFFDICSYPRLLLEVFIKEKFGERYFSFSSAVIMAFVLFYLPLVYYGVMANFSSDFSNQFTWGFFVLHFLSWYVFLVAFLYVCVRRRKEVRRSPSVFDFARYSLSGGAHTPLFKNYLRLWGNRDIRKVEVWIEPSFFFFAGFVLDLFGQWIGTILIFSSILYALSFRAAYRDGDNFVMDKIDEMIMNEEMESAFIHDDPEEESRGVRFYMRKPNGEELRRKVKDRFTEDDHDDVSVAR